MSGFLAGLFTGVLMGAVITLLVLMTVVGVKSTEPTLVGHIDAGLPAPTRIGSKGNE
jgi:hypothetical protein